MISIGERLARAPFTFGAWCWLAGGDATEAMAGAGYDFLVFDTQHGALDWSSLLEMLRAAAATPALVRTGWFDPVQIMRALDLGAAGVIVPMVSTPEQAQIAAQACRYPPHGNRSMGPIRHHLPPGQRPEPLCLPMIETAEGLRNVEAIAATPGIDGLYIGPVDLALSMGETLESAMSVSPRTLAAIDEVVAACARHGIFAGTATIGSLDGRQLVERGVRLVTMGIDIMHIRNGAAANVAQAQAWLDEIGPPLVRGTH